MKTINKSALIKLRTALLIAPLVMLSIYFVTSSDIIQKSDTLGRVMHQMDIMFSNFSFVENSIKAASEENIIQEYGLKRARVYDFISQTKNKYRVKNIPYKPNRSSIYLKANMQCCYKTITISKHIIVYSQRWRI